MHVYQRYQCGGRTVSPSASSGEAEFLFLVQALELSWFLFFFKQAIAFVSLAYKDILTPTSLPPYARTLRTLWITLNPNLFRKETHF